MKLINVFKSCICFKIIHVQRLNKCTHFLGFVFGPKPAKLIKSMWPSCFHFLFYPLTCFFNFII